MKPRAIHDLINRATEAVSSLAPVSLCRSTRGIAQRYKYQTLVEEGKITTSLIFDSSSGESTYLEVSGYIWIRGTETALPAVSRGVSLKLKNKFGR